MVGNVTPTGLILPSVTLGCYFFKCKVGGKCADEPQTLDLVRCACYCTGSPSLVTINQLINVVLGDKIFNKM